MFQNTMINMNWREIKGKVDDKALVLLPLGVIEEHGPHLCLGTDILTANLYCQAIKEKLESKGHSVVVAPPFYWGVCQSTEGFIGSFRIRKETTKALLDDILYSLKSFGFNQVFGVNAHGDIDHSLAIIDSFKKAQEDHRMNASYAFDEWRIPHFGFEGTEPYLCPIEKQVITVSTAEVLDVHAGDIETAIIHHYYPDMVDANTASQLEPVPLKDDKATDWLFGGHINELSPMGYLGTPSNYDQIDVEKHIRDFADRVTRAILKKIE